MNALFNIQQKLKVGKNQHNKFGGYNYRSQEDILEALKPLLAEEQATLLIRDELREVGGSVFVDAIVKLEDSSGKTWTSSASAEHAKEQKGMSPAQITGAASSYARKYALNGMFLIDDTKDADATNDGTKVDKKKAEASNKPEPSATPTEPKRELPWLNEGSANWDHVVKRLGEGVKLETFEKTFRLSKASLAKLKLLEK